jgi:hypothetical protein
VTWRPAHTAPFGETLLYAFRFGGSVFHGVGERAERAEYDDEKPMHIGVLQCEEHSGNYWTDTLDSADQRMERDVLGWMPLPELPQERVR